jgi:HKD family nuclease
MNLKCVVNSHHNHATLLKSRLAQAQEIIVCVAFLKTTGLRLIRSGLEKALKRGASVKFLVGLDLYLTEPAALYEISRILAASRVGRLLVVEGASELTYHPKLYAWRSGRNSSFVIGSANLTAGGLSRNVELSVWIDTDEGSELWREVRKFVSDVERMKRTVRATTARISSYERKYELYRKRVGKAERAAAREIDSGEVLDPEIVKKYLAQYRANADQQRDWRQRVKHYREAKAVLEDMARTRGMNKARFLASYERLVGAKNCRGLWHSGSLFRAKNLIAKRHMTFLKLLKEVRGRINADAVDLFASGMKYAKSVKGLGVNAVTELMNTYAPDKFSVLNANPVSSLELMGFAGYASLNKNAFPPRRYGEFNELIRELARDYKLQSVSHVDHFLNFVYWKHVKKRGD